MSCIPKDNEYFVFTTKQIDYGIKEVDGKGDQTKVTLERLKEMPMPIRYEPIVVTYDLQGWQQRSTLHGFEIDALAEKPAETDDPRIQHPDWPWTHPSYEMSIDRPISDIASIEIDPSR